MGAYDTQGFTMDNTGRRIVVDPVTRIEGHMRCEVNLDSNNVIRNAVSTGTMWRGLEVILKGRDPRDAWAFVERICGVCTGCHALTSVRAVEDALGITIPKNAYLIREIMAKTLQEHDHAVHFYHLHALDWVDVVSALKADPKQTSVLQQTVSPSHPMSSPGYFRDVQNRLKKFVESGQLGPFMNGYWGNKAYVLPPEANLMAVTHYLEALDLQKEWVKVHTIFGGKNPHPNYLVGGVPCAINIDGNGAAGAPINMERLNFVEARIKEMIEFNNNVYIPDVLAIGTIYKNAGWLYGGGLSATNVMDYGTYEKVMGNKATQQLPGGAILDGNWDVIHPVVMDEKFTLGLFFSYLQDRYNETRTGIHSLIKEPLRPKLEPEYADIVFNHTNTDLISNKRWFDIEMIQYIDRTGSFNDMYFSKTDISIYDCSIYMGNMLRQGQNRERFNYRIKSEILEKFPLISSQDELNLSIVKEEFRNPRGV